MSLLDDIISNLKRWVRDIVSDAINSIRGWVKDKIKDAIAGIEMVTNYITENITNVYKTVEEYITNVYKTVEEYITNNITNITEYVTNVYKTVEEYITNNITNITKKFYETYNTFTEYITNVYNTTKEYITNYITEVSEYVTNVYKTFVTNVQNVYHTTEQYITNVVGVTAEWVGGRLVEMTRYVDNAVAGVDTIGFFKDAPGYIGKTISNIIVPPLLASLGGEPVSESPIVWYWKPPAVGRRNLVAGWIYEGVRDVWDGILKSLGNIAEMMFGAVQFVVDKLKEGIKLLITGFMDLMTEAMTEGSPPKEIMIASSVLTQTMLNRQIEMINKAYESAPTAEGLQQSATDIQSLMVAAAVAAIGSGLAADLVHPLKNTGFRPTMREIVYWSGIPAVTAAIATTPTAIGLLIPLRQSLMASWEPMIPPATDIIRFSVREVYLPERRDALIKYYPGGEYDRLMSKQGFKQLFREHYWMSHWILASIGQLNEMLYRSTWSRMAQTGAFTPPTGAPAAFAGLDAYMWSREVRYNDLIPEAIPWLKDIIYKPYTRVDIRRMWDMRTVTRDEVKQNYLWLGYDEEHAEMMTIWTLSYTAASDIRALYARGHITSDEALAMFVEVGVPEARAEIFVKKLVTYSGPERTSTERDLTKTDILRMFKNGTFTVAETVGLLMDVGYSEDEAAYLVELYQYQDAVELKELTMSQIFKSYRYDIITREEAKNALMEAGWSKSAAETLLQIEDIKRKDAQTERARERDLTRTDIAKAMGAEIITVETGYMYLGYLGYSDWEIRVIFALAGIELPAVGG